MVYVNHGEALEWDLLHFWNMDINDPDMTVRRLWNFFSRLPARSETMQDIAGIQREARDWDNNTWLLANVIDSIQALDWHTISAYSKNKPKPPKPYPRPATFKPKEKKRVMWPGKTIVDKGVKNG